MALRIISLDIFVACWMILELCLAMISFTERPASSSETYSSMFLFPYSNKHSAIALPFLFFYFPDTGGTHHALKLNLLKETIVLFKVQEKVNYTFCNFDWIVL